MPVVVTPPVRVLAPAKVWVAVVTIPPLVPSAGDRLSTPEVIVAPFAFEDPLIEPIDNVAAPAGAQEGTPLANVNIWPSVPLGKRLVEPAAV